MKEPDDELREPSADPAGAESELPGAVAALAGPRWLRALLLVAGAVSLVLAVLGIFLPLLPTTPLVLLAGFCFARGSTRAHGWLLRHRVFGPIVRDWQQHRSVPPKAKWTGVALVFVAFAVGFQFLPSNVYVQVAHLAMGSALVVFLASLPTTPRTEKVEG